MELRRWFAEAGTQTDYPDATMIDRETQTDQYSAEATNSKEVRPFPVLVETRESQVDDPYEQYDEHVGSQWCGNVMDSIDTNC